MGNPCRYFFDNKMVSSVNVMPILKKVSFGYGYCEEKDFPDHYDSAIYDCYSAPDFYLKYANGNTTKDEFSRIIKLELINLKVIEKNDFSITYSFEKYNDLYNLSLAQYDVPIGKFAGMTKEEVDNYNELNYFKFDIFNPKETKMYKLAENLYQGSAPIEPMEEIGAVFNLMLPSECVKRPKPENFNPEIYVSLPIEDGYSPGIEWLKTAVNMVLVAMQTKNVYIHCRAGVSRSATLAAAVLMKIHGWNRDKALNFMAEKNKEIDPAPAYLKLLDEFARM